MSITDNPTYLCLQAAQTLMNDVAVGKSSMTLICSPAGLGKTYLCHRILRKNGIKLVEARPANVAAFVQALWDSRDEQVLVLDDCDFLASQLQCINIAKMAFGPTRTITYQTREIQRNERLRLADSEKYNDGVPAPRFKFNARLIWLSNVNFTDETVLRQDMRAHFGALVSRGLDPFWVRGTPQDHFDYAIWLATEGRALRSAGYRRDVSDAAVEWFQKHQHELKETTPRRLQRVVSIFALNDDQLVREQRLAVLLAH